MECQTKYGNGQNKLPLPARLYHDSVKHDIESQEDGFYSFSSRGFLQDFHNFDNSFTSFHPDFDIQTNDYDPFDPFFPASFSKEIQFEEFKVVQEMEDDGEAGFLNFPNRKNLLLDMETAGHLVQMPLKFSVTDETSCVTAENVHKKKIDAKKKRKRNESGSASSGRGKKKSVKAQWTVEEDRILIHLVEKFGLRKWSQIAQILKGRIGKQCRERWHNHLRPDIKKDVWSEEEDKILIEAHAEIGNKWSEIAKKLPGRTENSIKNHWNATKRRQFSRRKCRTKWPKPSSILQDYIQSLNQEKEGSKRSAQTPGTHPVILGNNSIQEPGEKIPGFMEVSPGDHLVPSYNFDPGLVVDLDGEICVDDVPFHMPPFM